jgi:CPA2 family monovalent cation:H+ antiporter-2
MPHELDLIATLTGGLTAALLCGLVAQRLGLAPVVGYLIAGVLVGPFTPGYVAQHQVADQFAEIGVILLMFGVGLHFQLPELLAVRRVAVPGAVVQIVGSTALGIVATRLVGWSLGAGVVFGLAISVASTVVLLRVLADQGALRTPAGHVAVGWLVVEDLFTVLVLVLLPAFAAPRHASSGLALAGVAALAVGKLVALVTFTLVIGRRTLPWLLARVARTRSRELFTLAILVVALGIALGSAKVFGASMALGAFLAGLVVGQSHFGARAASEALPMRDAFAVLFFVATGMLFDPRAILANWALTLATLAIVLVAKPLIALGVGLLLRKPVRTAFTVAVALAQIGEFSFILAGLGRSLGIFGEPGGSGDRASQPLVLVSMLSIALNPLLFRAIEPCIRWLEAKGPESRSPTEVVVEPERRVIIVGYGPVGRTLARLLEEQGFTPTIIDLNVETVKALNARGGHALYGDAGRVEVLEHAGVAGARTLVFAASGAAAETVRVAKELNPGIRILARTGYLRDVAAITAEGADAVVAGEEEVAIAMGEWIVRDLGAGGEQLGGVRARLRAEFGA